MMITVSFHKICHRCFHSHFRLFNGFQAFNYNYFPYPVQLSIRLHSSFSHHVYKENHSFDSYQNLSSFNWLSKYGPGFPVNGNAVTVLYEPNHYYNILKENIKQAKRRVVISSLYFGISPLNQELVNQIINTLKNSNGKVEVLILIDYVRGQRGNPNSCHTLLPLLRYKQVQIALYHTPHLRGILKSLLPDRWNELTGLQHMKLYMFDDSFLMSGANLSEDYFVNRQDRYILIENNCALSNYLHEIMSAVASFSFQLCKDGSLSLHPSWKIHPFIDNEHKFKLEARTRILSSLESYSKVPTTVESDTIIYPLMQMGPLGLSQDEEAMKELLQKSQDGAQIVFASGYFNLTDIYKDLILSNSQATYKFIMASPTVSGFYGANGIAGAIPSVYSYLASVFHQQILEYQQQHRVRLLQYERDEWTFHAKGIWYYRPNDSLPILATIGSPNFGYRSVYRDLELQLIIVTENEQLRQNLHQEQATLCQRCFPITQQTFLQKEHKVKLWVKGVSHFFQNFF